MEARFPIRLIAMDLDGTLVGPDLVLRPRTVAAFRAAVADGVQISIATGRMAKSARPFAEILSRFAGVVEIPRASSGRQRSPRPFAEILGQTAPIIAYQGALIRDM